MEFVCATPYIDKKYCAPPGGAEYINIGLRERNKFYKVVDIDNCMLESEESNRIVIETRKWAARESVAPYDTRKHEGLLRYLVIREGKTTGQVMVVAVFNMTKYHFEYNLKRAVAGLVETLKVAVPGLSCFIAGFFTEKADIARYDDSLVLLGDGAIMEKIGNISYRVSAESFFQPNSHTVSRMYSVIRDFVAGSTGESALDIYCGCGGITLFVADLFERVIGVEQVPSAIEDAKVNAGLNGITNCEFVCDRAEIFMGKLPLSKFYTELSTVIVDPPRAGITKKALNAIIDLCPGTIVYASCNPQTLFADLQKLVKYYRINSIQPVDMFPHTPHIETIVKLVQK